MATPLLESLPLVESTRRNHALEHATLKVLSERFPGLRMAGVSTPDGFFLIADLPTEVVTDGVLQASARLRAGERDLAIHPNCGTNLATSTLLAGSAALLVLRPGKGKSRPSLNNYFLAAAIALPIFLLSKPLGLEAQRTLTTDANLGETEVRLVVSQKSGNSFIHQIRTNATGVSLNG